MPENGHSRQKKDFFELLLYNVKGYEREDDFMMKLKIRYLITAGLLLLSPIDWGVHAQETSDLLFTRQTTADIETKQMMSGMRSTNGNVLSVDTQSRQLQRGNAVPVTSDTFPDEQFRSWILENIAGAQDGELTLEELAAVRQIDVHKLAIVNLKGIEYFTNLEELVCGYVWTLKYLDVSQNVNLVKLDCRGSKLGSLDVSKNTKLERLSCSDADLNTLQLGDIRKLKYLYCYENNLKDLDVYRLTDLEDLYVYNNKLQSIDVTNNPKLKKLRVDRNKLTTLDVSNNKELWHLDCEWNNLLSLDVRDNTKLIQVYFAQNRLVNVLLPNNEIRSGEETWYTSQAQNHIGMDEGHTFDLKVLSSTILPANISNLQNAQLQGTILTNLRHDTVVTYDYDCGAQKTLKVSLHVDLADYTRVNKVISQIPSDLNVYTQASLQTLKEAYDTIIWDKSYTEQSTVDSYASAIQQAVEGLIYKPADYSSVDQALAGIPEDTHLYTEKSLQAVTFAKNAVIRDKNITEQSIVDGYASAIQQAIKGLIYKPADYSSVDQALAGIPVDTHLYTEKSLQAVTLAKNAVIRDKNITEQSVVDGYASAIRKAVEGLVYKDADYTRVDMLLAKIPADLNIYKDASVTALLEAKAAIVRGKSIKEQREVDLYAEHLEAALYALQLKEADVQKDEIKEKEPLHSVKQPLKNKSHPAVATADSTAAGMLSLVLIVSFSGCLLLMQLRKRMKSNT